MNRRDVGNVLCVVSNEIASNNSNTSHLSIVFPRKYTKYANYAPWPTPCEVAVEMATMARCEHLAASSRDWAAFDWAEHCLKQARRIKDEEQCAQYVLRQWEFM